MRNHGREILRRFRILRVISYLSTQFGSVHPVVVNIPWVTLAIKGGWLAIGGHLTGAVPAAINLALSIAIYFLFVLIQERMDQKKLNESSDEGQVA